MIVWKIQWIFLLILKSIYLVESDAVVHFTDFILDNERTDFNENDSEYIRLLNIRNQRAKRLGIPFRATKSAPQMENSIDKYCEPACVKTGIWMESSHGKLNNCEKLHKPPTPTPTPTVAQAPCDVCRVPGFMYMASSMYCIPFANPDLKEYLDGELQKIVDKIDVEIEKRMKTSILERTDGVQKGRESCLTPLGQVGDKFYFKSVCEDLTWYEAELLCQQGTLSFARVESVEEFDYVQTQLPNQNVWVGGKVKGEKIYTGTNDVQRGTFEWTKDPNDQMCVYLYNRALRSGSCVHENYPALCQLSLLVSQSN